MDFELSEENRMFREAIREFAEREIAPLVEEAEATHTFPKAAIQKNGRTGLFVSPLSVGDGRRRRG